MPNPITYFLGQISQKAAAAAIGVSTPPTFAGIASLTANANGSLTAAWLAASSPATPIEYQIFIQASTATGLFNSTNMRPVGAGNLAATIFTLADGTLLQSGVTYYVGVRAKQAYGISETNVVTQNAASLGVPSTSLTNLINGLIATIGTPVLATIALDIASRASQASVNLIPTNPLLTTDSRLNHLDADISSRADGAAYTPARAAKIDNLDATISSRATDAHVLAIPTNPLLTTDSRLNTLDANISSRQSSATALTQYNALVSALSSIQNNTMFSGIVPALMDEQYGASTEVYTFYAGVFNESGSPADPDSQILNYTVKDQAGNILKAQAAMTRDGLGVYHGTFTVTSAMVETDVVVFFNYAVASVAFQQVRTSKIISIANDSANIAAIKAKTDNLPSDPASNTQVNTRASQASVDAIPTNPLLTTDSRLNNLDASISSRASQASVNAIPTTPAPTAVQVRQEMDSNSTKLALVDTTISSRASQASLDADFGNMSTLVDNLQTTTSDLQTTSTEMVTTEAGLETVSGELAATEAALSSLETAMQATSTQMAATESAMQSTSTELSDTAASLAADLLVLEGIVSNLSVSLPGDIVGTVDDSNELSGEVEE